jgi:hypothetical protein
MLVENGIVRVGCEIEVAAWKRGTKYQDTASQLIDAKFMEGTTAQWNPWHQYNCKCRLGCARIAKGDILLPTPLVSMQYDASLPERGAEFIISPVLLIDGMDEMKQIWEIVCKDAIWTDKKRAMRGGELASPSIHLHVSAMLPGYTTAPYTGAPPPRDRHVEDALHALSLFGVEFIALSDITRYRRGLAFRQPWRNADGRGRHHGFVHVRQLIPGQLAYIEWRMFEAAYNDWEYFETAAYLSGAITRSLLKTNTLASLMEAGYRDQVDPNLIEAAIANNDTEAALALVSRRRLRALRAIVEDELYDDTKGLRIMASKFEEVETRV